MKTYISSCGRWRPILVRDLPYSGQKNKKIVTWIMLNPSTADHTKNDPTTRRVIDFSSQFGASRILVVNLFDYRTAKPANLLRTSNNLQSNHWMRFMVMAIKASNTLILHGII